LIGLAVRFAQLFLNLELKNFKDMTFEEFKTRSIIKAHELIMAHDLEAENLAMINRAAENAKFDILGWIKNKIHMTITEKEIREDFARFIRHEAMRANATQTEIMQILNLNNAKREFE
jgi:hypothetical protein